MLPKVVPLVLNKVPSVIPLAEFTESIIILPSASKFKCALAPAPSTVVIVVSPCSNTFISK